MILISAGCLSVSAFVVILAMLFPILLLRSRVSSPEQRLSTVPVLFTTSSPSPLPSLTNTLQMSDTPLSPSDTSLPQPTSIATFTALPSPAPSLTFTFAPAILPSPTLDLSAEMRSIGCTCRRLPEDDPLEKDCNRASFNSSEQARRCYGYCLGVTGEDIYGLDQDGNGIACETDFN